MKFFFWREGRGRRGHFARLCHARNPKRKEPNKKRRGKTEVLSVLDLGYAGEGGERKGGAPKDSFRSLLTLDCSQKGEGGGREP